jgi:hypothetical protein
MDIRLFTVHLLCFKHLSQSAKHRITHRYGKMETIDNIKTDALLESFMILNDAIQIQIFFLTPLPLLELSRNDE